MKAEIKAQWVKDLRSGEFEQGKNHLERVDKDGKRKLCCLGVLCRQAVKAGVIPAPELHGDKYIYLDDADWDTNGNVTGEEFNQGSALPRKVREWAGLDDDDIIIEPASGESDELTGIGANDALGMSFAEIADLAEKNVPVTE